MKNSKEWFSVSELLSENLKDLPSTDKGISKKADREGWQKRQRTGVRGKTFEYYVGDMPPSVQAALGVEVVKPTEPNQGDVVIRTAEGYVSLEMKTRGLKPNAVQQALEVIEQALSNANKAPSDELNNIEWHLVRCFRKASEEGKEAILSTAETMATLQEKKEEAKSFKDNLNAA